METSKVKFSKFGKFRSRANTAAMQTSYTETCGLKPAAARSRMEPPPNLPDLLNFTL
jgi:hypothetical protein